MRLSCIIIAGFGLEHQKKRAPRDEEREMYVLWFGITC